MSSRKLRILGAKLSANEPTKKIIVSSGSMPGAHLTADFGGKSGIIDVHRTETTTGLHETLYAIDSADLTAFGRDVSDAIRPESFLKFARRLSLGWMHRNHIGFVMGAFRELQCTRTNTVETETVLEQIRLPEWLEDIYDVPDRAVPLLKIRRGWAPQWIGVAFKVPQAQGTEALVWFKRRDLSAATDTIAKQFQNTLGKYRVGPEVLSALFRH